MSSSWAGSASSEASRHESHTVQVAGCELLNFCSNDHLGLAADPRIAEAFKAAVDRWGTGAPDASHLVCRHTCAHEELESNLADFTGRPRALLFSSGYGTNVGVINALLSVGDHAFQDRLNHTSLLDGGWISRATFSWYGHLDLEGLHRKLECVADSRSRKLIVSDGTFSMDGDQCLIHETIVIAHCHDAWVMIDDAHGMGVHGRQGIGLIDPQRYSTEDGPVLVGTLGKAFGTYGGFVAGDEALIETLIKNSRNYIYTTALPSAIAAATLESLTIARAEEWHRQRLEDLIQRFRSGALELGFELMNSQSPIQPLVVGNPGRTLAVSRALEKQGSLHGHSSSNGARRNLETQDHVDRGTPRGRCGPPSRSTPSRPPLPEAVRLMPSKPLFVTGTDTEVGKTFICIALLRVARAQGLHSSGFKPVATGCTLENGEWRSDDALELIEMAGSDLDYATINPVALEPAIAAHSALVQVGRRVSAAELRSPLSQDRFRRR